MDHRDHVRLLRGGVDGPGGTWADIGAGTGAFTLALADLLGPGSRILAVDRDRRVLETNRAAVAARFAAVMIETRVLDLAGPDAASGLPALDGIVAANSLHFLPRLMRIEVVRSLATRLRPGAPFVVVEYDTDAGNQWVPHPFAYSTWEAIAATAGLVRTERLEVVPSRFLGSIYSAVSRRVSASARRA
jgi:SAM-dependent methyltransferase